VEPIERIEVPLQLSGLWPRIDFAAVWDQKKLRLYMFGGAREPESKETLRGSLWGLDLRTYSRVKPTHDRRRNIMVQGERRSSVKPYRIYNRIFPGGDVRGDDLLFVWHIRYGY
jgi:hypothetical protein